MKPSLSKVSSFQSFRATFTIPQLTFKFCYILMIFVLIVDLICHSSITYCLRYQGDRVLFRLFCIIYQSVMLVHILNEIATLWVISRVSHFGKKFQFSSANPGSHSNNYIRKVSSYSEFSSNIYYFPIYMQILVYIDNLCSQRRLDMPLQHHKCCSKTLKMKKPF